MSGIISVVAGGWSVKEHDLESIPGYIIAINDSAINLPRVDCVVSMDRLWTENRWDWLRTKKIESWIRVAALKNRFTSEHWLKPFQCDYQNFEFTTAENTLNGTNSALCGFNRAFQFSLQNVCFSTILLYGFDMQHGPNGEKHWYADYPWNVAGPKRGKLVEWSREFSVAARKCQQANIQVYNMSSRSLIKNFERGKSEMVWQ